MRQADDALSNPSSNLSFEAVMAARYSRRLVLAGGLAAAGAALLGGGGLRPGQALAQSGLLGFRGVPVSTADTVVVPPGYSAEVLYAWGDPIGDGPAFRPDATNTIADQERQAGMHHDAIHYFSLPLGGDSSTRGLLVMNHEYTDDGLLHVGGMEPWTAEKVAKSQAAHGTSVIEVASADGRWRVERGSTFARRITARTPMGVSGPAAGHALLRTAFDADGRTVLGTINNCGYGATPWGTYLACEENFNGYFVNASGDAPGVADPAERKAVLAGQKRYGIYDKGLGYRWHEHDERFDAARHPNEPHRFGWVVEIDPFDPKSQPVKHTALGRFKHEGAFVTLTADKRVVVYSGDDERNEYVYKFVSAGRYVPADRAANLKLLEQGTLYVARFNPDGSGQWLPLAHGQNGLDAAAGFQSQADVLVNTRAAADVLRPTKMDRPEWIAVHPKTGEVYVTLTNNNTRGTDKGPATDPANPRATNVFGHIVRWKEDGGDAAATRFAWNVFLLCGDPASPDEDKRGTIKGDVFGSPDGLWFDARGVLWIQTDVSTSVLHKGDYTKLGNNQMLAADPATREVRRFLTGPSGSEITGVVTTPDGRTMFVNIQHPGETSSERSDPNNPTAVSSWPDGSGRPRAATVVVRRRDGGVIGA
jgi:secreted PhoX family phosphatase